MNKQIFKIEGQTIWMISYHWTDDYHYNLGFDDNKDRFLGTQKEFDEWVQAEQDGQGMYVWNVKKRHATEKENEEYKTWLKLIRG